MPAGIIRASKVFLKNEMDCKNAAATEKWSRSRVIFRSVYTHILAPSQTQTLRMQLSNHLCGTFWDSEESDAHMGLKSRLVSERCGVWNAKRTISLQFPSSTVIDRETECTNTVKGTWANVVRLSEWTELTSSGHRNYYWPLQIFPQRRPVPHHLP